MCGIVGFITPDARSGHHVRKNVLAQGLLTDSLRGMGGTGLATVSEKGDIAVHKRALTGADFLNSEVCELAMRDIDSTRIAIGHNRAATIGSIKDLNCHPFHYEDKSEIVLVHNGTLSYYHSLSPTGFNHDVDSAHAARGLAACGTEEETKKFLQKIDGPFVFVWHNATDNTFNIARNSFRDIYYVTAKDGTLWFASEFKMLDWLLFRNGVEMDKGTKFTYLEDHKWFTWDVPEKGRLKKPKSIDIKPTVVERVASAFDFGSGYPRYARGSTGDVSLDTLGLKRNDLVVTQIIGFEPYSPGPVGRNTYGKIICSPKYTETFDEIVVSSISSGDYDRYLARYKGHFPVRVLSAGYNNIGDKKELLVWGNLDFADLKALEELSEAAERTQGNTPVKTAVKETLKLEQHDTGTDRIQLGTIYVTAAEWERRTKDGCCWCKYQPVEEEAALIKWIDTNTFMCDACSLKQENAGKQH